MNAEIVKEIIKTISQELAVPTKELLSAVYELQKADAISTISISIITILVCVLFLVFAVHCIKSDKEGMQFLGIIMGIICGTITLFMIIAILVSINQLIVCLTAPKGAAIKALLQMIKTK